MICGVNVARRMTLHDIDAVVCVHIESFKRFFLTFLGEKFLRVLYSYFLKDPSGIAIVVESNKGKIIGFVAGTLDPSGFYSRAIRARAISFAFAACFAILRKPSILGRLCRALRKPTEAAESPGDCELMTIGVSPTVAGMGVGKVLERSFCDEALQRGAKLVRLTTDHCDNDYVNTFYIHQGYVLDSMYTTLEGRKMNLYLKTLQ